MIFRPTQLFYAFIFALLCAGNALAEDMQADFVDWSFFKTTRGDMTICYLASTPIKNSGYLDRRGEPYFLVTDVVDDADEVTASSGFIYKASSDVEVSFGSRKFYLFPYLAVAWANDVNDDLDIIKEMQKSDEMIVSGTSRDNKVTHDTYSLIGFAKAYQKLKKECK